MKERNPERTVSPSCVRLVPSIDPPSQDRATRSVFPPTVPPSTDFKPFITVSLTDTSTSVHTRLTTSFQSTTRCRRQTSVRDEHIGIRTLLLSSRKVAFFVKSIAH